jgi:hypothetical protein
MLNNLFVRKPSTLDEEIERVLLEVRSMSPDSVGYGKAISNLKMLYESRGMKTAWTVDINVVIQSVAVIGQMLLVLNFEKLDIISSQAFGFISKGIKLK